MGQLHFQEWSKNTLEELSCGANVVVQEFAPKIDI